MGSAGAVAHRAPDVPVRLGTAVRLAPGVTFYGRELVAGGAPWRLLRLSGASVRLLERWRVGGEVGPGEERFARTLVTRGFLDPLYPPTTRVDDVDVVIPVHNDASRLSTLLESLRGFSVTVVDDESDDARRVAELAARFGAGLVTRTINEGPAAARNDGVRATTRPFIWFIDADVELASPRSALGHLLGHFEDPLVAAVAPRVRGPEGPRARDRFERDHGPLDMGPTAGLAVPGGAIGYVPSACLLVRRSAFGDGFDEELRIGEDVDFVWRLHDEGWLVRYDASVQVTHAARARLASWWSQRHTYGRSAAQLAMSHPDRVAPLRADAWTLGAWVALLARQPRAAAGVIAAARQLLESQLPDTLENRSEVANLIAVRAIGGAGGPLARATVRSYTPLLLGALAVRQTRPASAVVLAAGTLWRWHGRGRPRVDQVAWAILDDLAYASGLWRGAFERRSTVVLRPRVTGSVAALRRALRPTAT